MPPVIVVCVLLICLFVSWTQCVSVSGTPFFVSVDAGTVILSWSFDVYVLYCVGVNMIIFSETAVPSVRKADCFTK